MLREKLMKIIKRILGASLLIIGMTIILLGVASAAGIIVIVFCPFIAIGLGAKYWEESKGRLL